MTTLETLKTKDRLHDKLLDLTGSSVLQFKRGDNRGPTLGLIFVWQEVKKFADEQLKKAWKVAVSEDLIDDDDILRDSLVGEERILAESNQFSVVAKLEKPRRIFSRDRFIIAVAKKYKLDPARLEAIAEDCMVDSAAPLHKRVLEA